MRALLNRAPTSEQLAILSRNEPGAEVIRGAAGSGKTTTALLRIRSLAGSFLSRRKRLQLSEPVRILVLTYNRTLRGYIKSLADSQVKTGDELSLEIFTFSKWAKDSIENIDGAIKIISGNEKQRKLTELSRGIELERRFLLEEIEYVMGRFVPEEIDSYIDARRDGRGIIPRMEKNSRIQLIEQVIRPYQKWLDKEELWDWHDLADYLAWEKLKNLYDIIIVDETQDLSANEIRAIKNQLKENYCLTLILDTTQRIYARGFTWQEVGITVRPNNSFRLKTNHRNTYEIAKFAASLLTGVPIDDDGTMPDFSKSERRGSKPLVLVGKYSDQVDYALDHIREKVDLKEQSVAFLHMKGGGWFDHLRTQLDHAKLPYIEIARRSDWPEGDENIALSTVHSVKGLEFDHVIILGINQEVTPHGEEEEDGQLMTLRRLLAMGIGRARMSVLLGYKSKDASRLISYLDQSTYTEVKV